jgi:hypothetical protein
MPIALSADSCISLLISAEELFGWASRVAGIRRLDGLG